MDLNALDPINGLSALASASSAIFAYLTYRATVSLKKHDFILQLATANETLRALVNSLPELLKRAEASRKAIDAAQGLLESGTGKAWQDRMALIQTEVQSLQGRLPGEEDLNRRSLRELTNLLATAHKDQLISANLVRELEQGLEADDRRRGQIREDHRSMVNSLVNRPFRR